jgi:hypothetical protein
MCHNASRQLDAWCDKSNLPAPPSLADDFDRCHHHIPRDANGAPEYFILPIEVRPEYEEQMAQCEAGWQETADPAFVGEATFLAHAYRQPVPRWLADAVTVVTLKVRGQRHVAHDHNMEIRWRRYRAVLDARGRGLSWADAWEDAVTKLEGTDAQGETTVIKKAYMSVAADLRDGRNGRFASPLLPNSATRRRLLGDT